jgi:hypothetical protein
LGSPQRRVLHQLRSARTRKGKKRAFDRNRDILDLLPIEAILCEGSGIQNHLYELFNPKSGGRRVPTHVIMRASQKAATPLPKTRRRFAALTHRANRQNMADAASRRIGFFVQ